MIQKCDKKLSPPAPAPKAATKSPAAVPVAKTETKPQVAKKASAPTKQEPAPETAADSGDKEEKKPQVFKTFGTLEPSASPVATSGPAAKNKPTMPKYQYYQNDKFMTIAILEGGISEQDVHINIGTKQLTVILRKQGVDFTVIANSLYTEVVVDKCKVLFKGEKVLIKLKKENEKYEWYELLGKKEEFKPLVAPKKAEEAPAVPRPYASHKDWDRVEKDLKEEEKNEKPGDNAMNKFFQQIYADADEETRRAMIKSYQTSGGTVLSCNWDEVKEKDYEGADRVAPKGMEWKNWEGKKFPVKEDD